ncbi:MAG: GNAT family N-acetyltransferase [Candidatus Cloacimonetes bacterium]|nr:GNAT family N-acetyltransferase [Candidatus Cloacimonadota bacterium]MBS3766669.1 GNAT family N-acetyltransferase [Candidatus Cloacimonadota bacterium]
MIQLKVINKLEEFPQVVNQDSFIEFLHNHLDKFGDSREAIKAAIEYTFSEEKGKGGFLLAALENDKLIGALVMNHTGMTHYIPENILVYIAVHEDFRGKGLGTKIIDKAREITQGEIALHVEYDNPAKKLYERLGFDNKYAEMRLTNKE